MNSLFFKGSFVFGCKNINIILKYNAMFIIFLKKISFTQTVKFEYVFITIEQPKLIRNIRV